MKWLMVCCQELSCHDFNKARGTNGSAFEVCFSLLKPSIFDRQCCNSRVLPSKSLSLWREVSEKRKLHSQRAGKSFEKGLNMSWKLRNSQRSLNSRRTCPDSVMIFAESHEWGWDFFLCDLCDSSLSKSSAWWSPWIRSRRSSWAYTTSWITDFTMCFFHVCVSQISTMRQHEIK